MQCDAYYSGIVAAGGTCVIEVRAGARQIWEVSQVSTEMQSAPAGATSEIRKNDALVSSLVANGDVAGGSPTVQLRQGDVMSVSWAGCTPGKIASAYVIYDDGIRA